MDEVAQKIRSLVAEHGTSSIAVYIGTYAVTYPVGMYLAIAWTQALARLCSLARPPSTNGQGHRQCAARTWKPECKASPVPIRG